MIRMIAVKIKAFVKQWLEILLKRMQWPTTVRWFGNDYGGFYVDYRFLGRNSIVYSFGVGEDISFDLELIETFGCCVYAFDFTPQSIEYLKGIKLPRQFRFYDYGIAPQIGEVDFYCHKFPEDISGSYVKEMSTVDQDRLIRLPVKSFADIVDELGHKGKIIDLVKLDIEGAEYGVFPSILETGVDIKQICLEVHERFLPGGG